MSRVSCPLPPPPREGCLERCSGAAAGGCGCSPEARRGAAGVAGPECSRCLPGGATLAFSHLNIQTYITRRTDRTFRPFSPLQTACGRTSSASTRTTRSCWSPSSRSCPAGGRPAPRGSCCLGTGCQPSPVGGGACAPALLRPLLHPSTHPPTQPSHASMLCRHGERFKGNVACYMGDPDVLRTSRLGDLGKFARCVRSAGPGCMTHPNTTARHAPYYPCWHTHPTAPAGASTLIPLPAGTSTHTPACWYTPPTPYPPVGTA
jgi:hypothetical protein